ncbi:hypothetical protein FHG87_007120 [Trinorchestia longiramus]|nr:hypothetical protein FHG87_007120 [Trinorchestia longiramus]
MDQSNNEDLELSAQELQIISELDSRQFGFIKLNEPQHAKKKSIVLRAIKCLERIILVANNSKTNESIYENIETLTEAAANSHAGGTNSNSNYGSGVGGDSDSLGLESMLGDTSSLLANVKVEPQTADDGMSSLASSTAALDSLMCSNSIDSMSSLNNLNNNIPSGNNNTSISSLLSSNTPNINNNNNTNNNNSNSVTKLNSLSPPPSNEESSAVDPETYCKLGHFHLLLEDFPKACLECGLLSSVPTIQPELSRRRIFFC